MSGGTPAERSGKPREAIGYVGGLGDVFCFARPLATHSRFVAATTATTSGGEATTSSGARWTSYSNG